MCICLCVCLCVCVSVCVSVCVCVCVCAAKTIGTYVCLCLYNHVRFLCVHLNMY